MRKNGNAKAILLLQLLVFVPTSIYLVHGLVHPFGYVHNYKASMGTYQYWMHNFMTDKKDPIQIYRPEFYYKQSNAGVTMFT
jgi:hypothetical protein